MTQIIIILVLTFITGIFIYIDNKQPRIGDYFPFLPSGYGVLAFLFGFSTVIVAISFLITKFASL